MLIHVLYNFTTLPLLRFRRVSHRFQSIILRIVHSRLLLAASLEDRKLILECYHPSAQYSEPYLYCDYLGTPGLSDRILGQGSVFESLNGIGRVELARLYSRFKPTHKDPQFSGREPHPAGDILGSRTSDAADTFEKSQKDEPVTQMVTLEAHENFSQLVLNTDLVQLGPRRGVFLDIISVSKKKTFRIFRNWLARQASPMRRTETGDENLNASGWSLDFDTSSRFIWTDESKRTAGLKVLVEGRRWRCDTPLLLHRDEDQATSYSLELQGTQCGTIATKQS